uniref:Uncharacterized protein n=1 Tax=Chromera velia CCMP2878 TaxID=1169474 RepID=A0A0G4GET4_9ALVE|eukprot:Cvel_21556.t1-p1 / transcript=Cvel_21556.t1 / gene=Cvel_21556 / organism=Chromera_velia_CCMP2878 / gene_product=hypothetical protein / transcript_product=hypothetical protein / location=Cvel_scaffold2033:12359-12828(+) / protein_length=80 / sequence_SO=supercontig / SO=protein_coding / is_pseudo=false
MRRERETLEMLSRKSQSSVSLLYAKHRARPHSDLPPRHPQDWRRPLPPPSPLSPHVAAQLAFLLCPPPAPLSSPRLRLTH